MYPYPCAGLIVPGRCAISSRRVCYSRNLRDELKAFAAMPDDQIDTTDIPEIRDWSGAVRGLLHMSASDRREALRRLRSRRLEDARVNESGRGEWARYDWAPPTGYIGAYIAQETRKTLDAYRSQPNLVVEHAHHEEDTTRGGYARRQLFELIQNGADALSDSGGGRIWIGLTSKFLYCADEGQPIDQDGVTALMFAYLSPKRGTDEIGRFGMGFKSVLGVTDTPEFFSRSGSFRFDRTKAAEKVRPIVPDAERYPILRLPEAIDPDSEIEADPILGELMGWASNIVRLPLRVEAFKSLDGQMEGFPGEFLLFVEHVTELTLQNDIRGTSRTFALSREEDVYFLSDGEKNTRWMVVRDIHELSSEAMNDSRGLDDEGQVRISWAAPLDNLGEPGRFWAFFPTVTTSLLAGILNAPWKTNEDRQNLLEGIYNRELVDAAASMVARTLPSLSTDDDPGLHLDALPRRREAGDNEHSIRLRSSLYSILEEKDVVPDQEGVLRRILAISYAPENLTGSGALQRWAECENRPKDWLHHSALTPNRQARLGLTERSYNQPEWKWLQLRRAHVSEWLEALTKTAESEEGKIQASMEALQTAIELPDSLRGSDGLGEIVLTSSETWVKADPEKVFLGGGDASIGVSIVHPELQKDPETLSILRELGIRPLSPETAFREGIASWSSDRSEVMHHGPMTRAEYRVWMEKNWEFLRATFPEAVLQKLQRVPRGNWSSSAHFAIEFLKAGLETPPEYEDWVDRYWTMFWDVSRDLDPHVAAKIIRDSSRDWRDLLRVRTVDGQWRLLVDALLPGPVVPADGSRDSGIAIDTNCHSESVPLLQELGAVDSPEGRRELSGSRYWRFRYNCRREFLQQDGLPRTPRDYMLNFTTNLTSGPLDVMESLSEEGRVEYTWRLLDIPATYESWTMRHDTRDRYPAMDFPSPALDALRQYGRIRVNDEIHDLSECLGDPPGNSAVLEKLLSHPRVALIRSTFGIPDADDAPDDIYEYRLPVDEVKAARETVRSYATDELRLLAAVGEPDLRKRLPAGLIEILEVENEGHLNGLQVARAAIATFHTGALREYRDALGHLDPPQRWAGSPGAVAFVKSLGFGEEWAMERNARRDPYIEVEGPFQLPKLHPYQRKIVAKVRELISSNGSHVQRRGMISLPTGSGKTRVAVQSIVEAIREDEFSDGILWVADRDELCEQAVESWQQVWRSEGLQGSRLRISRMWGGQPTPLPTADMHVIVATIQTLSARIARQPDKYEFLADFKLLVFDEAHRSVTPTFTSVMQELGLTRWRRAQEPILIGLTATPYRGRDERETERLVNRYGSNRLDEGAFKSADPERVIGELQEMGVLAKAGHATIQGGQFHLSGNELRLSENVPWLPQSVERRIADDTGRTRRIIEAYKSHVSPDWPTLIFATSVEHSKTIAALLTEAGVSARAVSAETDTSVRRRIVERFRAGQINVLVNYGIFREGFDAPKTKAIIVARPVYSPNLYFQMVGRGLRGVKNGGNNRCLILNVRDNIDNFQRELAFSELDWLWD